MKNKKPILIIMALCCVLLISACEKKQDDTGNTSSSTTASKNEEKSGENVIIDVFSELNVTFEGENDDGEIICEYTGNNEFVKEYVDFKSNYTYGLRNGELVTVTLNYNEFKAEQQNITFKEFEREYTVEGLWGSIVSPDGYDFSEIDNSAYSFFTENEKSQYVKKYLNKLVNSQNSQEEITDDSNLLLIVNPDGHISGKRFAAYWRILSLSCEPYAKTLHIITNKDSGQKNTYTVYYKISLKAEKTSVEANNSDEDTTYNVGDIKEWDFIGVVRYNDVSVENDSNMVYPKADPFYSSVLDTDSENYNADFNTFFDDFFTSSEHWHYFWDFNSDTPEWVIKK